MHIVSVDQFDYSFLNSLFDRASYYKELRRKGITTVRPLQGKLITNLFYEPSTRTASSFFSAASLLGASVNQITNVQYSSVSKGESFEDTIMTLAQYSDAIVLRHPIKGYANLAANISPVPIINAGDGAGEHPTQTLLDLFTIKDEIGILDSIEIAIVGDLKYGRTVHSLMKAYSNLGYPIGFTLISPEELKIPEEYKTPELIDDIKEYTSLDEALSENRIDVLYMTRIQKERFDSIEEYNKYKDYYVLTPELMEKLHEDSCVMHPLPRVGEISPECDKDSRAAYFRQVENGLFTRMALLEAVVGG